MTFDRPSHIPERIVETETVAIAREAARFALDLSFTVHLIGRPGTGKSSALWHIANQTGGTYCEISHASKAVKGMLRSLLSSAGYLHDSHHEGDLTHAAYRCFQPDWIEGRKLLIVDEVQTLEATAFRELLRLQEKCGLGLVIAGNAERLANTRKDADTWAQIESRIAMRRHLPGPGKRDCELIGSNYNVEGRDAYAALANFGMRTSFRDLVHILETAKRLTAGVGIRKEHLERALRILISKPDALKLFKPEDD